MPQRTRPPLGIHAGAPNTSMPPPPPTHPPHTNTQTCTSSSGRMYLSKRRVRTLNPKPYSNTQTCTLSSGKMYLSKRCMKKSLASGEVMSSA